MNNRPPLKKPLPIGKSFFDKVIEGGSYYVDKTMFVKDLIDNDAEVTLVTRPRRFGKTLNQTMLKCFFEDTSVFEGGKDTRALFRGLRIEEAGERYMGRHGKYPVVFLTFKEAKFDGFDASYDKLRDCIAEEFKRHAYVAEKIFDDDDRDLFKKLSNRTGSIGDYTESLKFLSKCLENYHGQKAVILIDEYDVPLENSWYHEFYPEMINFIRPLLSSALKDNPHLQFAVITGCLRISKESIFTGLNNLEVVSILSDFYSEHFGFTQGEMDAMLAYYGLEGKTQIIKDWYDGYLFGNTEVYNPWSSIQAVSHWSVNINRPPEPHWSNTSSNSIVRNLIDRANSAMKADLETLMAGGTISKIIAEDITYNEIDDDAETLWNFLFFTGYLKKVGDASVSEDGEWTVGLSIPNIELKYIYKTKIQEWFRNRIAQKDLSALFNAIINGDAETFQDELTAILSVGISVMDSVESHYHGIMIGVLARLDGYGLKSNRESGEGRYDLVLYSENGNGKDAKAIIFELKKADKFGNLSAACEEALKQIEDKNYAADWINEGYGRIIKYGIGFYKKRCAVRKGE